MDRLVSFCLSGRCGFSRCSHVHASPLFTTRSRPPKEGLLESLRSHFLSEDQNAGPRFGGLGFPNCVSGIRMEAAVTRDESIQIQQHQGNGRVHQPSTARQSTSVQDTCRVQRWKDDKISDIRGNPNVNKGYSTKCGAGCGALTAHPQPSPASSLSMRVAMWDLQHLSLEDRPWNTRIKSAGEDHHTHSALVARSRTPSPSTGNGEDTDQEWWRRAEREKRDACTEGPGAAIDLVTLSKRVADGSKRRGRQDASRGNPATDYTRRGLEHVQVYVGMCNDLQRTVCRCSVSVTDVQTRQGSVAAGTENVYTHSTTLHNHRATRACLYSYSIGSLIFVVLVTRCTRVMMRHRYR